MNQIAQPGVELARLLVTSAQAKVELQKANIKDSKNQDMMAAEHSSKAWSFVGTCLKLATSNPLPDMKILMDFNALAAKPLPEETLEKLKALQQQLHDLSESFLADIATDCKTRLDLAMIPSELYKIPGEFQKVDNFDAITSESVTEAFAMKDTKLRSTKAEKLESEIAYVRKCTETVGVEVNKFVSLAQYETCYRGAICWLHLVVQFKRINCQLFC